ncbi:sensor histidine kinase [Halosimplex sp. J119]
MNRVSNEVVGAVVAVVGLALTGYHLSMLDGPTTLPGQVVHHLLPPVLSIGLVVLGVQLGRGRLVDDRDAGRLFAWTAGGSAAFAAFDTWAVAGALASGKLPPKPLAPVFAFATFGAVCGALVGLYDSRRLARKRFLERLNRINDTLRIATQELVHESDRDSLEQTVCDRLTDSDPYDAVWIGRYDASGERVHPTTWAGFDDEYVESIEITVDDSPTGRGPGGRAIRTREIQCVPDVFEDRSMEPWWDLLESHGIVSLAVVPIYHDETVYGFFSIYTNRDDVFDERERAVLSELGETIGHAIAAIEAHERLAERERELARQNERLEEFAGVVSHDLRNPLNVAAGRIEITRRERDSEHLAVAADALDRMEEIISDVLTLARQGETVDDCERVQLGTLVEQAWSTVDAPAATLRTDGDLGSLTCDPSRVRELLENLFRNAVEHGGPDVTVTVSRTDDGFSVADDGPGIPPAEREAIFEAGFSTNHDGTGFGLNIVERIAQAHGWEVTVGENADGGTADEHGESGDLETERPTGARFEFTDVQADPRVADCA